MNFSTISWPTVAAAVVAVLIGGWVVKRFL